MGSRISYIRYKNAFASFSEWFVIISNVFASINAKLFTSVDSMPYFLTIHDVSDALEEVIFARVSSFYILAKIFPQFHLIIKKERPQNNITHIVRYFNIFPLIPLI